ncbi:MAG: ATP-binding protein [Chloroherpetonaceae bacterium]
MAEEFKAELTVQSSMEQLEKIRGFVSKAAEMFGFKEDDGYKIVLAVDEACSNIIRHGYGKNSDEKLHIVIQTADNRFTVTVNDNGKSYDIRTHPLPDMETYLASKKKGGLGIKLIRALVDEIEYEHRNGENKLVLVKRLPAR